VPPSVVETVLKGDRAIKDIFFAGKQDRFYLTRAAFVAMLEALVGSKNYELAALSLDFNEIYVPARVIPELSEHLRRYARLYATELAKSDEGVVTYINLGVEKFVQGAGRILSVGYVITLDYGSNWEGIISQRSYPHLRTYGPAHREENWNTGAAGDDNQPVSEHETSDPYRGPTLNDLTTDVNFSLMAAEGRLVGLKPAYFGPQSALQTGTQVSLVDVPSHRQGNEDLAEEYRSWADSFQANANYKLMVQQKDKTDPAYAYPATDSEPLASDEKALNESQRQKAALIEKRLSAQPEPAPAKVARQ